MGVGPDVGTDVPEGGIRGEDCVYDGDGAGTAECPWAADRMSADGTGQFRDGSVHVDVGGDFLLYFSGGSASGAVEVVFGEENGNGAAG